MTKKQKIIYWFFTCWLALGMVSTGIVQLLRKPEEVENFSSLGYPIYLMTIIGVWKLLGTVAVLAPKFSLLKEWAYAGFFFCMSGAAISHIAAGHSVGKILPPLLLLALTVISWYTRPANRKIMAEIHA
ncbi:MAG: DoxX family protein [Fibrobacteria bacterium]